MNRAVMVLTLSAAALSGLMVVFPGLLPEGEEAWGRLVAMTREGLPGLEVQAPAVKAEAVKAEAVKAEAVKAETVKVKTGATEARAVASVRGGASGQLPDRSWQVADRRAVNSRVLGTPPVKADFREFSFPVAYAARSQIRSVVGGVAVP